MKIPHPSEMRMLTVAVTRYWELTHFYLLPESDTLSALVAPLTGNELPANLMIFVPSCEKPFNRVLHSLPHCEGVIVKSTKGAVQFELDLSGATQYAIDIFNTTTRDNMMKMKIKMNGSQFNLTSTPLDFVPGEKVTLYVLASQHHNFPLVILRFFFHFR